jgi:hypothetical protein
MKLSFQHVLIHINRGLNEGVMVVCLFHFCFACCSDSERANIGDSTISAYRNTRLTWFLTCWKRNFMGLLNIQIYYVVLPMSLCKNWSEQKLWIYWRAWSCELGGTWLLPIPMAWTNDCPWDISLKNLIDMLTYLVYHLSCRVWTW